MKKLHLIVALQLFLLLPSMAFSAPKVKSVKSFKVIVPDTVVQGDTFTVAYALEATHWKESHVKKGSGMTLVNLKWERHQGKQFWLLIAKAKYITSRVGSITLPPMSAEIDGEEVLSEPKEVFVKPHPQYGEEMTLAHEWLVKKGVDNDSLSLDYSSLVGNFFFFSDQRHECFCLVAKKDTWSYSGNPIWAYSLECSMGKGTLMYNLPYFFKYYSDLLTILKNSGEKVQELDADKESVLPLLGELRWGQRAPYNSKLPSKDNKRVVVGCVPLAMAMVMKYYEWPKQGTSNIYFETEKKKFDFDCKEFTPQWEQYRNNYAETEVEECADLSKVLGTLALIMSPKYGDSETSANMNQFKHIMCNNMGYSGRITRNEKLPNMTALRLLKQEITNRRPCVVSRSVSRGSHAFVCDGLDNGYFHFNFGWRGQGSGYYRVPGNTIVKDSTFFRTIISGIEPQKSEQKKEVTLVKAGTLGELLSEVEKENLTSLTVSGPINRSDVRLIRAMAGAKGDSLYDNRNMGTLKVLDLTDATITKDKTPYRTRKATSTYSGYKSYTYSDGTRGNYTHKKDYNFDFNNMNEDEWYKFKTNFANMQKGKGLIYTRVNDTKYYESSFCIKNTIGSEMFSDCSSLRIIKLPLKTKAIYDYAFLECSSLQKIQMPASTKEFGKQIFQNCLSLEKVYLPRASSLSLTVPTNFGYNLSPGFKIETYRPQK